MKKLFTIAMLAMATLGVKAQNLTTTNNQVSLNLFGASYAHELSIGRTSTLIGSAGLRYDFAIWGDDLIEDGAHLVRPTLGLEYRNYYNLNKRLSKSRSIDYNSGNFISVDCDYTFKYPIISSNIDETRAYFTIAPNWGIRRVYNKFFFEAAVGVNIHLIPNPFYYNSSVTVAPKLQASVGFVL